MNSALMQDGVWRQQQKYEEAEAFYQAHLAGAQPSEQVPQSSLKNEIAQARQQIQNVLKSGGAAAGSSGDGSQVGKRLDSLEKENKELRKVVDDMKALVRKLESRVDVLEGGSTKSSSNAASASSKPTPADDDDDEDIDLFGDDSEDEAEKEKKHAERVKAYTDKKAKKPAVIAKSSIILDVKPWDDETDMKEMEKFVRQVTIDGLLWGGSKLVPLAYGIKKLQINCVVEDDKVGTDDLEEAITANEDLVQSVDIVAFNKI